VRRRCLLLALLAALYTGLNALKPLQVDDAAYQYFARQFATRPLDPYGFAVLWYDRPDAANTVLAPPVLPAYWGAVRALVGERPWLWKLALFPWALLFVAAVHTLLRRFARGVEMLGTWLLVLSPAFLPSLNLMLDVPALALGLTALNVFFRAVGRSSYALAAWAGLLAGLAMQTKYTAFLAPGVMLLYALFRRRPRFWAPAALVATQVFVTWELVVALLYGRSHFVEALPPPGGRLLDKLGVLPFLFSDLGGVAAAGTLIGLAALGLRRIWLALAAGLVVLGYGLIVVRDGNYISTGVIGTWFPDAAVMDYSELIFDVFSAAGVLVLVLALRRLWAWPRGDGYANRSWRGALLLPSPPSTGVRGVSGPLTPGPSPPSTGARGARAAAGFGARTPGDRAVAFLICWLMLEVVGYLFLTPFPAVRRVLGVAVVLTVIVARLAARTCRTPERRRVLHALGAGGVLLGLAYYGLDWQGARVQQLAAESAAAWVRDHGGGRAWYVGHWGFQYYAERAGLRPVVTEYQPPEGPIAFPPPSRLRAGDWLIVPDSRLTAQAVRLEEDKLRLEASLVIAAPVRLRTVPCFYGGRTPLEREDGEGALEVKVYRVTADFTPVYPENPG
jgi:hypothetical protein